MSDNNSSGNRKRSNPGDGANARKRGRYTPAACNECKKRKTKCTGSFPCRSCSNLDIECVYSLESAEILSHRNTAQIVQDLQQQVQSLWEEIRSIKSKSLDHAPPTSHVSEPVDQSRPQSLTYHRNEASQSPSYEQNARPRRNSLRSLGPTSSGYGLQIAEPVLKGMGVPLPPENDTQVSISNDSESRNDNSAAAQPQFLDLLQKIGRSKALALIEVYREDIGLQYPFLNIESLIDYVKLLFSENPHNFNTSSDKNLSTRFDDGREEILAATLAVSLAAQREGEDMRLSDELIKCLEQCGMFQGAMHGNIDRKRLIMLILQGMYYFFRNDERMAWRIIGITARMCEEAGFNRQSVVAQEYENLEERQWLGKLFWSIYVLDRRWSFGVGLTFALDDSNIDLNKDLPNDDASRYLKSMIDYCHIASKVWQTNASSLENPPNASPDEKKFLEYLIWDWLRALPLDLKISDPEHGYESTKYKRGNFRLRILLHLRANQMCILIYRNALFTQHGLESNKDQVQNIIDTACESIRILVALNKTSDIYRTQQICFNHFLDSALTVLVLAVCKAPNHYPQMCRKEFHLALELIQTLSMPSPISKRLWQVVQKLKDVAFSERKSTQDSTASQSAAAENNITHPEPDVPGAASSNSRYRNQSLDWDDSGLTSSNHDISNIFWELFEAGSYSFREDDHSRGFDTGGFKQQAGQSEADKATALTPLLTSDSVSTQNNSTNQVPESASTSDVHAVDITGQRALQRTELDFFDITSHVQSPYLADLSNDMFFF